MSIIQDSYKFKLREPFAAGSHLLGAGAAILGASYLLIHCNGSFETVFALLVYSISLTSLLLTSGLFHGLHCDDQTLNWLEKLDYAAIYFFIAGTYTPACLFAIPGVLAIALLSAEWVLAIIGIWLALTRGPSSRKTQVAIYLAMGWGFLFALPSFSKALSPLAFNLLILGGVAYSIGAVIFTINWKSFLKTNLSAHDVWHVLVLLGSAAHFAFVVQLI